MPLSKKNLTIEISFLLLFLIFSSLGFIFHTTFDSGDSIQHYLISRYSWQHPALFLNHWGKPVFTILSSPFSQLGFKGIEVFNCLVAVLSAYCCFLSAKRLALPYSYLIVFILFGAPVFFQSMYSGLTEPLFALFLVAGFYYIVAEKLRTALILISFLPLVRTEGFIILIIYGAYLVYEKKWTKLPWLAFGTCLFSIIGYPYYKDVLWIFHENPYTSGTLDNYGKGNIAHYFSQFLFVTGIPYTLLVVGGLLLFGVTLVKNSVWKKIKNPIDFFILYGCFLGYFFAHVVFWSQGLFHSFGMSRVLIAILPLGALIAMRALNFIFENNKLSLNNSNSA